MSSRTAGISPARSRTSRTKTSSSCGSATSRSRFIGRRGKFYATQDECTHEFAYLSDGVVVDCVVECPFHQGRFDVRDGKALSAPVVVGLKTFPVKIENGNIYVQVTREATDAAVMPSRPR